MQHLLLAMSAMFLQQTCAALGRTLPAVIAPSIIADLRIDAVWIGVYFGLLALSALVAQLGCGSFIVRYGALRVSQVALVMLCAGCALAALIGGSGGAVSTPASSHLLSRCTTPRYLPLVFSIKQTAVPAGLLVAGLLGPPLAESLGWRTTMLLAGAVCVVLALALQPLRERFDDDRVPTRAFRLSDFRTTLAVVLATRELRTLSYACLAFNGLQTVMTAYFVIYLTTIGFTPVAAGFLFSVAMAVAVPGRILWGWIGSTYVSPRLMMAGLAFGMAASAALLAFGSAEWPVLLVGLVACALSATALSWHGLLLAETARASPEDMRGGVTGGVLSFGQVGAFVLPLLYSGLLDVTGSYGMGFVVCGLPALFVGVQLLRRPVQEQRPR